MEVRMGSDLDDFVLELQEKIYDETRDAYGDVAFERWRNPRHAGRLEDPDGYGRVTGSCGDTMQIFLKFEGDRVQDASFETDGCGSSTVCGSFAAEMAIGRTPDELLEVTGEAILETLGGLPEEERHCAFLAAETVQEALNDYMVKGTGKVPSQKDG
jgi:nitrogen fixation protein NifU and related proteins